MLWTRARSGEMELEEEGAMLTVQRSTMSDIVLDLGLDRPGLQRWQCGRYKSVARTPLRRVLRRQRINGFWALSRLADSLRELIGLDG